MGSAIFILHNFLIVLEPSKNFFIMNTGKVKFFNATKGFGFIKDDKDGKEYFVPASGLIDQINENDLVSYDLQEGRRDLNAVNVKKI